MNLNKTAKSEESWKMHIDLLRYVDCIENKYLRALIKTKVLDVANSVKDSIEELEGGH